MSDTEHDPLLPPNQTQTEAAVALSMASKLNPDTIRHLWNPQTCPVSLLPWLAWSLAVSEWDDNWQTSIKRKVIAESVAIHRQKGSVASVQRALSAAGYPYAQIDEKRHGQRRDGNTLRDGWPVYGGQHPYVYRVRLNGLISVRQAAQIRRILANTAPVRCHLHSLDFRAQLLHNKAAIRDGSYTRGAVHV
jgi:phage tail P2-like protein